MKNMNTLYIITPICYSNDERIEYFKRYIEHVERFNSLSKIQFVFFAEPDSENMVNMIPSGWNKTIFRNYYRFKPALNHFTSFKYCFDILNLDYAFLLEDDIISSPDIYNLSKYCLENNLLTDCLLCTLNKHELYEPNHSIYIEKDESVLLNLVGKKYVSCWGTGISKKFWDNYMFKQWRMDMTFDAAIDLYQSDCKIISPLISRTNQIGEIGLNYTSNLWRDHNFKNIKISNNIDIEQYKLISVSTTPTLKG